MKQHLEISENVTVVLQSPSVRELIPRSSWVGFVIMLERIRLFK